MPSPDELRAFYGRYVAALNAHDLSHHDELIHDEVLLAGEPVSRADVVAVQRELLDVVPDFHWEVQEVAVDGDRLAARLINTGTPAGEWLGTAPTGASFEIIEFAIYAVHDGRFSQMTALHDAEALRLQLAG